MQWQFDIYLLHNEDGATCHNYSSTTTAAALKDSSDNFNYFVLSVVLRQLFVSADVLLPTRYNPKSYYGLILTFTGKTLT